jgi:hypothetical protein
MQTVKDFRFLPFDSIKIGKCGKYVGRQTYWKLYAIENIFRIIIHSVLSVQSPPPWWDVAVDRDIRRKAERFQGHYLKKSWHGKPGTHAIYYIDLKDLGEIFRANAHLFYPVIPELDKWILGIEDIRLPRNVVAHMNFPNKTDEKRIDVFYEDCLSLINQVKTKLNLSIP